MEKIFYTKKDVKDVAQRLLEMIPKRSILCLQGAMGAGKTTLIKAFIKQLGGKEQGNSPTFSIANEYHNQKGELLAYHFDFYRLNDPSEALDLGLEDYLNKDTWIFMEWPEMVAEFLPENSLTLELRIVDATTREISIIK